MSLAKELTAAKENFVKVAPDNVKSVIFGALTDFQASYDVNSAIKVGQTIPEFQLPNATGETVSSTELLKNGPLLISFYRGEWCPFCNLELVYLQRNLDKFQAKGVTLVAISPELPDTSLSTTEKHDLKFPVLSDVGNKFAKQLGIVWRQPDSLTPIFKAFGNDLEARNGDASNEVPIPATLLIDEKGTVRNIFLDPDYTTRLEPATALQWVDELKA